MGFPVRDTARGLGFYAMANAEGVVDGTRRVCHSSATNRTASISVGRVTVKIQPRKNTDTTERDGYPSSCPCVSELSVVRFFIVRGAARPRA